MNRDEALELLEFPESDELQSMQSHYRLLRSKWHPDSSNFDGVVRNLAQIKEAYDFLMGNTWDSIEQPLFSRKNYNNPEFNKFHDNVNSWLEWFLAREKEQIDSIIQLLKNYDLISILDKEDPFIKLLVVEFDDHFLEALYMEDTSLDREFGRHFDRIKATCFQQWFDFHKFIRFFEDNCIRYLLLELAFKYNMDSMGGIDFFIKWWEDILHGYGSSRSMIGIIDNSPDLFQLYPYFTSEVQKYYQRVPDKKQTEFIF